MRGQHQIFESTNYMVCSHEEICILNLAIFTKGKILLEFQRSKMPSEYLQSLQRNEANKLRLLRSKKVIKPISYFKQKFSWLLYFQEPAGGMGDYPPPETVIIVVENGVIFQRCINDKGPGKWDRKWINSQFSIEIFVLKLKVFSETSISIGF